LVYSSPGLLLLPAFIFLSIPSPLGLVSLSFIIIYIGFGTLGGVLTGSGIHPLAQCLGCGWRVEGKLNLWRKDKSIERMGKCIISSVLVSSGLKVVKESIIGIV